MAREPLSVNEFSKYIEEGKEKPLSDDKADHLISSYRIKDDQSSIDDLTGVYNRRVLEQILYNELNRQQRSKGDLDTSFIYIDLDGFKDVNDTLGHHIGDRVLRQFGIILKQNLRAMDSAGRMGQGDEFGIILPEANSDTCDAVLDRLYISTNQRINRYLSKLEGKLQIRGQEIDDDAKKVIKKLSFTSGKYSSGKNEIERKRGGQIRKQINFIINSAEENVREQKKENNNR